MSELDVASLVRGPAVSVCVLCLLSEMVMGYCRCELVEGLRSTESQVQIYYLTVGGGENFG